MKKIILILMLTVFGFSYSNDKTYNITKNYSVENINSFSLINRNASIKVLPTDSKEISLSITSNIKLEIKKQINSQELKVSVLPPHHIFTFFSKNEYTTITVSIPKNLKKELYILSRNGSITASDLILNSNFRTRNGSINISNIKGNSNINSRNGEIYINNIDGNVDGKTRNGHITVINSNGYVSLKTHNGSIDLINSSSIKTLETHNGHINASSKILLKSGKIKTSNGSLILNIDKLEGTNEISSSRGHITMTTEKGEFNSDSISEDKFKDTSKNITIEGKKINIIIKK